MLLYVVFSYCKTVTIDKHADYYLKPVITTVKCLISINKVFKYYVNVYNLLMVLSFEKDS